jgi:hypothetical protein
MHFCRYSDCREVRWYVANHERVSPDHCAIADGNRANNARVASNVDMIAYRGPSWLRSGANCAHVVECAVSTNSGIAMNSDRAAMGY